MRQSLVSIRDGYPTDAELATWLARGGDERLATDALGRSPYGCAFEPESDVLAFSSSTASTISAEAFQAARERLSSLSGRSSRADDYANSVQDVRRRLAGLCALPHDYADGIVLGASGTDLHLLAAELARGDRNRLVVVMPDAAESGRGVARALQGRRFGALSPHGAASTAGAPLGDGTEASVLMTPLRLRTGAPRDPVGVDAEIERAVERAVTSDGAVLLILLDVSKTGLVGPSPDCARGLKRRHADRLTVLVDACQFRLSSASLAAYLAQDFVVAVTGSKFLGGPTFSGALLIPPVERDRLGRVVLSPAFGDYSGRADWPEAFLAGRLLGDRQNLGLLLRWEAALSELEAFGAADPTRVHRSALDVSERILSRINNSPAFEPFLPSAPQRPAACGWDAVSTIFPFGLRTVGAAFDQAETELLYRRLRDAGAAGRAGRKVMLGQPVVIGERDGRPLSVLRVAISARQLASAANGEGGGLLRQVDDAFDRIEDAVCELR